MSGNQLAAAGIIFLVGLVGSLCPLAVHRFAPQSKNKKCRDCAMLFLSLGSCFGGGVFIAAGFVHLLGDASYELKEYMSANCTLSDDICGFPWDMLACSLGLLLTMFVDSIPYIIRDKKHKRMICKTSDEDYIEAGFGGRNHENLSHGHAHEIDVSKSPIVAYILLVALSFHSFVAGIALGVEENAFNTLLIAILAHKGFAAFALGAEFVRAEAPEKKSEDGNDQVGADEVEEKCCSAQTCPTIRIAMFMLTFCLVTPVGVIFGWLVLADAEGLVIALVTATAAGTFLYVGVVEVTAAELIRKANEGRTLVKIMCITLGFALMALLGVWS